MFQSRAWPRATHEPGEERARRKGRRQSALWRAALSTCTGYGSGLTSRPGATGFTLRSVTREPVMAARLSVRLIQRRSRPFRRDRRLQPFSRSADRPPVNAGERPRPKPSGPPPQLESVLGLLRPSCCCLCRQAVHHGMPRRGARGRRCGELAPYAVSAVSSWSWWRTMARRPRLTSIRPSFFGCVNARWAVPTETPWAGRCRRLWGLPRRAAWCRLRWRTSGPGRSTPTVQARAARPLQL